MQKRLSGLDLLKVMAVLSVISIHSIGNLNVLDMNMQGAKAFIILVFRYLVMSCVPLFLMITGFLQGRKTIDRKFYKGLLPILASYWFIAALGAIYNMSQDSSLTWQNAVLSVLNFTANNYSWYVEMFIGLFLLIPFLNIGYNALQTKKKKQILLAVLFLLTVAPTILTVFQTASQSYDILPRYWMEFYPITYYLLGRYIAEFRPQPNKIYCVAGALLSSVIQVIIVFLKADGGAYVPWVLNGFYSVSSFLTALFLFLAFYQYETKKKAVSFILTAIAVSSLDIYLFSNLMEKLIYPHIGQIPLKLPVMILIIFAASFIAAKIKQLLFFICRTGYQKLKNQKRS